jgi:hypothetical protein
VLEVLGGDASVVVKVDPLESLSELGDLVGLEEGLGVDSGLLGNEVLASGLDMGSGNVLSNSITLKEESATWY